MSLYKKYKNLDIITLNDYLESHNILAEIGGASYLTKLANKHILISKIKHYEDLIMQKSLRRKLYNTGNSLIDKAFKDREPNDAQIKG